MAKVAGIVVGGGVVAQYIGRGLQVLGWEAPRQFDYSNGLH